MLITEDSAKLEISEEKKISRKLPVFYNPVMKLNRDVSVLLLNSIADIKMQIALPLAGSGIRGIRFLKELEPGKIENISFNDYKSIENIRQNLRLNGLLGDNIFFFSRDANLFLLESKGFDYIDIDPFGTPNPFLESSIVRLARDGILAVTATDTSALAGSSPTACLRKYWAKPLKNEFMHETGIRILIRKVQLVGAEFEKALIPIFSFSKDHYYRVFFRCEKGRQKVDKLLKYHKFLLYNPKTLDRKVSEHNFEKKYDYAGPLWTGNLWDKKLVGTMLKKCDDKNKKLYSLVSLINEECRVDSVGFYDLHQLAKVTGKPNPKIESVLKKGKVTRTHFLGWGVKIKCQKKIIF
ncbi:tRNA (guanine(10)-N(2))-dimethyltransferase [Candidatus Woesearchaeota archaeon]|nr:tRNA (guanine(10)-N(2))-dimethyltransferase [Candidatus Woesearchaeota archaeon]